MKKETELMPDNAHRSRDHYEGFPRERRFHLILAQACDDCHTLKARTVRRIIAHIDPAFVQGLFKPRPCVRLLRYIGCGCEQDPCPDGDPFFRVGRLYRSIDFNGATYTIRGYKRGKERIGFAYFEYIGEPVGRKRAKGTRNGH